MLVNTNGCVMADAYIRIDFIFNIQQHKINKNDETIYNCCYHSHDFFFMKLFR